MNNKSNIQSVSSFIKNNRIHVPKESGLYAFWWIADKDELMGSKRKMILSGPKKEPIEVLLDDWWPDYLDYPCLYVGKTTNLKKRFSQHLMRKTEGRVHFINEAGIKESAKTTSCQLRYGIEHIFRDEENPLKLIYDKVGFSYTTSSPGDCVVERFYHEDLYIGKWRPWFNLDSER